MADETPNQNNNTGTEAQARLPVKTEKNARGSLLSFILFLLAAAALALSVFVGQQVLFLSEQSVKQKDYQLAIQSSRHDIEKLQKGLEATQEKLETSEQQVLSLEEDLLFVKNSMANITGVNRVDWLVDELQHLTRLAHQRLILSHDVEGTMALLRAADKVVIEMRLTSALPVRQAIAADLLNLRVAGEVDLEGAYIRLSALSEKIEEMNFRMPSYPAVGVLEPLEYSERPSRISGDTFGERLQGLAAYVLEKLDPYLFRSFRIDMDMKPVLSGSERQYLSRNMLMAIEEAQLALLRREPSSYQLSLEQSEKWIKQYYDNNDPLTTSILSSIDELKSYRLNPELPSIDKTLNSVKVFSDQWQEEKVNRPALRRSLSQ